MIVNTEEKVCCKCSTPKPVVEFLFANKERTRRATICRTCKSIYRKSYIRPTPRNRKRVYAQLVAARESRLSQKRTVLSQYGPNGELRCNWTGCKEDDVDVLTLDHIANNGSVERKKYGNFGGNGLYTRLQKMGYPAGYQTLCMNHQLKKEIMRRRELTDKEFELAVIEAALDCQEPCGKVYGLVA